MSHPALEKQAKRESIICRLFDAIEDYDAEEPANRPDWLAARVRAVVRELKKHDEECWR